MRRHRGGDGRWPLAMPEHPDDCECAQCEIGVRQNFSPAPRWTHRVKVKHLRGCKCPECVPAGSVVVVSAGRRPGRGKRGPRSERRARVRERAEARLRETERLLREEAERAKKVREEWE